MPATYEPIATTTISGSAVNEIVFSSISSAYTDLVVIVTKIYTSGRDSIYFRLNGDTGTNYSWTNISGDGASATSIRGTSQNTLHLAGSGVSTTGVTFGTINFFSYAGSTNKTCLMTGSADRNGAGQVDRNVGLWRNTAAINAIRIWDANSGTTASFQAGSTATLYGILKA